MARKNRKDMRFEGMKSYKQLALKKKISPQRRNDTRDWTHSLKQKLERGDSTD
jgi:sulfur transfer protein SufE